MKKIYHAIFFGGNPQLTGGRNIAGYRLRTSLRNHGYELLVVDTAPLMKPEEIIKLLENTVTAETLVLGFSTVWLDSFNWEVWEDPITWITDSFFNTVKEKFPNVKIVAGGTGGTHVRGAKLISDHSSWIFNGFSDDSFYRLLDLLTNKPDHGLQYKLENGKSIVDSNITHQIPNPDYVETIFETDDLFHDHQPMPLEVSRGCIFRCSFCSHPFQGAKDWDSYIRTPENLAEELRRNYDMFGTTRYSLMDDTFNDSIEKLDRLHRAIDLAKLPNFEFMSYIKAELLVTKPEMIPKLKELGCKAGYIGLESMNNQSRKIIKKGMDIDRVIDSLYKLRQDADTRIQASFIVGLPEESEEEIRKTHEFVMSTRGQLFHNWEFQALGIFYDRNLQGSSEIDKNPEKFGYTVKDKRPETWAYWENKFMNKHSAIKLANELNVQSIPYQKIAGWLLPIAWHLNIPQDQIDNNTVHELKLWRRARDNTRHRAAQQLTDFGCN
jgi:hypothetical protein